MNITIGTPKNMSQVVPFINDRVFVSQPYYKIVFESGLGYYIINSYKYCLFPKFYAVFRTDFWELGFNFAGWIFEIMWNKAFRADK